MKKHIILIMIIILIVSIISIFCFVYFGINNYNRQKFEILKNEDNQVNILKNIYEDFFNEFKIYDSGNITLDKSCLTNIIDNTQFNDNNIEKLKELEKSNVENEFIYTLYLEYDKENSILTLTLKESHGIQEYRMRYRLYVKGNNINYETYGLTETMHISPVEEF